MQDITVQRLPSFKNHSESTKQSKRSCMVGKTSKLGWKHPGFLNGDMLCEHEDQVDQSKLTANYVSPKVKNESDPEECARGVMSSLLNAVEEQVAVNTGKKRCSGRRLPMTDFCAKHLKLDPAVQLLDRCKECQAPCLGLDNKLCNLHAKKLFIPLPLQASQIPTASTQTISQRLAVKNTPRLAPLSASQWNMNSRQLPHQMMTRESPGFSTISSIRKPEHYDIRSLSGPLVIKSRRPRDTMQRILQGERQPNETMITEQSKLKIESSDNHQVWTIDEDLSIGELQKQCEQRAILDSTPTAPLQHQPKTKRSMLRINGSNGNGVVIRGPIAIIQHPGVGSFNSNIPIIANRNGKGINPNGLNGLNGFGCARVRVFERSNRKVFLS
ncbi:hypothetical protein M3Y97_00056500 [Aphelenchoides bicaudatus]|nr:hypothetical protein M3Y97_00056500 [Aphelenchoides bicaudatus]